MHNQIRSERKSFIFHYTPGQFKLRGILRITFLSENIILLDFCFKVGDGIKLVWYWKIIMYYFKILLMGQVIRLRIKCGMWWIQTPLNSILITVDLKKFNFTLVWNCTLHYGFCAFYFFGLFCHDSCLTYWIFPSWICTFNWSL